MLSFYRVLKFVFRYVLPIPARYPAARFAGRATCALNPRRRRTIQQNLAPIVGEQAARRLAPILLGNFLMTAVDFFCPHRNLAKDLVFENTEALDKSYRRTKKVILVTAHLGNYEVGMSYLVERGYSVAGVYAPYRSDDIVRWILGHRNSEVEWIPAARGAFEACRSALERGRVLGMVVDIPFGEKGRRVSMFGANAHLPLGPWAIAIKSGATIVPGFIVRDGPGRYHGVFEQPISPPAGTLRHQMEQMQNVYVRHLERYLRKYPEQWGVLQPFWTPS